MEQYKLDRINALAKKTKEGGLTDEEKAEREILRREYIDSFKKSLEAELSNTYIVDEKGSMRKLKKKD